MDRGHGSRIGRDDHAVGEGEQRLLGACGRRGDLGLHGHRAVGGHLTRGGCVTSRRIAWCARAQGDREEQRKGCAQHAQSLSPFDAHAQRFATSISPGRTSVFFSALRSNFFAGVLTISVSSGACMPRAWISAGTSP